MESEEIMEKKVVEVMSLAEADAIEKATRAIKKRKQREQTEEESDSDEPPRKKVRLNPETLLEKKLKDLDRKLPFIETLVLTADAVDADVDDDLEREVQFYNATVDAVEKGIQILAENKTPWQRPYDYYVEMVKSDEHMAKVKGALLQEKKKIKIVQQRRESAKARKFGKQSGLKKYKDRKQKAKTAEDAIAAWKKSDNKSAETLQKALSGVIKDDRKAKGLSSRKDNKDRKRKDRKYGKGGEESWKKKRNDGKNLDSKSFLKKQRNKVSKKNRPGKNRRNKKRRAT